MQRKTITTFACATLLGLFSGCGGNDDQAAPAPQPADAKIDQAFIAKVEAVCSKAKERFAENGPFPYEDFDPLHPDPALLPKVGAFFEPTLPIRVDIKADLMALGEPTTGKPLWHELRETAIAMEDNSIKQVRLAFASDTPAFVETVRTAQRLNHQLVDVQGPAAGFGTSSACADGL